MVAFIAMVMASTVAAGNVTPSAMAPASMTPATGSIYLTMCSSMADARASLQPCHEGYPTP